MHHQGQVVGSGMGEVPLVHLGKSTDRYTGQIAALLEECEAAFNQFRVQTAEAFAFSPFSAVTIGVEESACVCVATPLSPLVALAFGDIGGQSMFLVNLLEQVSLVVAFVSDHTEHDDFSLRIERLF